eukprot:3902805-Amphidinium_carterae.2
MEKGELCTNGFNCGLADSSRNGEVRKHKPAMMLVIPLPASEVLWTMTSSEAASEPSSDAPDSLPGDAL